MPAPQRPPRSRPRSGEDADLRRGRRYSVARRLAGLFAVVRRAAPGAARRLGGRPVDRRSRSGAARGPGLAARAVAPARRRGRRAEPRRAAPRDAQPAARRARWSLDLPAAASRCSGTPGSRSPRSSCSRPSASTATCTSGCRTPPTRCGRRCADLRGAGARRATDAVARAGRPPAARRRWAATCARLERTLARSAATDGRSATRAAVRRRHPARAGSRTTSRPTPPPTRRRRTSGADDTSVQVHACHGPARQVEVLREVLLGLLADDPDPRAARHPGDVPRHRGLRPADHRRRSGWARWSTSPTGSHPGHQLRVMLADRSLTQTNPLLAVRRPAARPRRRPRRGQPGARPARQRPRPPPVRLHRERPRDDHRLGRERRHPVGLRRARTASDYGLDAYVAEHLALRPRPDPGRRRGLRRRRTLLRHHPARSTTSPAASIDLAGRLAEASTGCRRSPTSSPASTPSTTGWTPSATVSRS